MTDNIKSAPSEKKRREIVEKIVATVIVALVLGVLGFCVRGVADSVSQLFQTTTVYVDQQKVIDNIKSGTVVNKEIINGYQTSGGGIAYNPISGNYGYVIGGNGEYVPTKYRIHILGEYEYEGEVQTAEVYFDVDANIYAAYKIGDYFDSEMPIISEAGTVTTDVLS